jgi:hypothetical protein
MCRMPRLTMLLGVALVFVAGTLSPALPQAAKTSKSSKAALAAPRPAITVRRAELNPENFMRFAPQAEYASDDTAMFEEDESAEHEPRRPTKSRLATQRFFPDAPPHPGPPGPPSTPSPSLGPLDGVALGHDPQVAAGDDYVAVIEAHHISFYDKSGAVLPNSSAPYPISTVELFQRFLAAKNKDGSVNQDNLNLHAGFPANPKLPCDLTNPSAQQGCIDEVYDLRVAYDHKHKRFIFVGNARNQIWGCQNYADAKCAPYPKQPNLCSTTMCRQDVAKLGRRYTLFAITKTEDPRQGFYVYWLPTAGDWPAMAVNGSRLLITENSICHDSVSCPPANTYPEIYTVSTDDMATGSSNVAVHWYLTDTDIPYAPGLRPVVSHDSDSTDYFVAPSGNSLKVWASKDPTKPLVSATIDLQETGFIRGSVVLQSGKLYYTYSSDAWCKAMNPVPTDCPLKVRLLAIKLNWANNKLSLSKALDYSFGHNGPGDDPSDLVSYEIPSLEVTKNGDVVVAYVRRGVKTVKTLYNEARYSVFYHNESSTRPSAVLKKGEGVATVLPTTFGKLDLAGQSLDPDGLTVWISQAYAKATGGYYGMAWGAVKP